MKATFDWDFIVVLVVAFIGAAVIVGIAAFEQNYRAQQYINWCIEEGNTKSSCALRWVEVRYGICQQAIMEAR